MEAITLPGNPPVEIMLRRSARARRLSLRMSRLDGRVTLTMPPSVPVSEARGFALSRETWLRRHLAQQAPSVRVGWGGEVPIEGEVLKIVTTQSRQIAVSDGQLAVPGPLERVPARVKGWVKARARDRLVETCDLYAARLGRSYARITLRDTRSRWGSCTVDGALMFSWRLILAPPRILEYVAAHEVAHLAHMDHSSRYWDCVHRIYGDPAFERRWLRDNGAALHRYRFED